MKKYLAFSAAVASILFVLFAILIPFVNDYSARKVLNKLEALPLPPNTEHIESISKAGKLVGNGNGMQYFGAMLIKSDLSSEEINEFYSAYRQNDWEYLVKMQSNQEVDIIEHGTLVFTAKLVSAENYYIIYSWGNGTAPFSWLDLRGN